MKHKFLFLLPLIFTCSISYAQYEIWETQLDIEYFTHLDRIYFLDENYGWAMGGIYFFTTDGGENWYIDWPSDHWGSDIVFMNQDTGFIAGGNGIIHKTTDGGQNWVPLQTPATQSVIKLFFVDENIGWATLGQYSEGYILHTIDGGNSWQLEKIFTSDYSIVEEIYFVDHLYGYCTGVIWDFTNNITFNAVMNTHNGGIHWDTTYLWQNTLYETNGIFFNDPLNGWWVGSKNTTPSSYIVMNTSDGGLTWTEQTLPDNYRGIPAQANCVFFINDSVGWIGTSGSGFGGSIYITKDGGVNWKLQQDFEQGIFDIQMLSVDTGWAVGGDFVYHTTNGSFVTSIIEHHVEKESLRIIPNPVSNTFCIETNIGFSYENCQLEITNITGNSILRLNSISFEAITSESIDLTNYPAGIYFVTLRYESNHQIKCFNQKIIKL